MKQIFPILTAAVTAALLFQGCSGEKSKTVLNGAGASFPAPVYQSWTHTYSANNPRVSVNYQSIGSGAGLQQIKAKTVDFAGTDNPLFPEELKAAGLEQFPMLTGGVVVIYHLPGVAELNLSRETLPKIFLGSVTRWNDPLVAKDNPGTVLPDLPITVVRRADASGTTFLFTDYLSRISPEWREKAGSGTSVKWPAGIGGQKNPGVCNSVAKISGAVGYTEYTYAAEAKLPMARLSVRSGAFIAPSPETFAASAANADWKNAPGFRIVLTDQPGENAWPITGVTYLLLRKDSPAEIRAELVKYFKWCFASGSAAAQKLNYVPIPQKTAELIQKEIFQ